MKKNVLYLFVCTVMYLLQSCMPQPVGSVDMFLTTADRNKDFVYEIIPFSEETPVASGAGMIFLDSAVRYQQMDGFGAAVTGSTCFNLMQMNRDERSAFLYETFSSNQKMGFSYVRISIGCSDFSLSEYTCCDKQGIENFALTEEETEYVIPILKEILRINPSVKVMGSPWTCPLWMKMENPENREAYHSWTGGQLNPVYYDDYATYFVKWISAFEKAGIPIYAVTPQNEPLNRGNSASLFMGWKEQADFIKGFLGPQMKAAGLHAKIYAFDHNYDYDKIEDQQSYPVRIYEDTEASPYIAGAAYHNYSGNKEELNRIHHAYPDKELVFTETSIGTWNDGRNLKKRLMDDMREVGLGTVRNWCRGVIVWNLMLDSERGPNREGGCRTCYGAVDIDRSDYKTITRNSHYYVIGHLSSVVKPGAWRIGSSGYEADGLVYSAFVNPDQSFAFVVLNDAEEERSFTLSDGERIFNCVLPPYSVVSYRWNNTDN
ncbi:MAG TPA: glucosylceramidase [Porphyromonadaceae bacterium]|nr:glucosylceramidase [Porphyromonadaceae bacterium]